MKTAPGKLIEKDMLDMRKPEKPDISRAICLSVRPGTELNLDSHAKKIMRKDYGRHRHTDWHFLCVWLAQTLVAAGVFLISLFAFASWGWGILSYLTGMPDQGAAFARTYHPVIAAAVGCSQAACARGYGVSVIFLLVIFLIMLEAGAVLLNRLAAVCDIRRYGI